MSFETRFDEAVRIAKEKEIEVKIIDIESAAIIRRMIAQKYQEGSIGFFWETAKPRLSISVVDGWRWFKEYIGDRDCILYFLRSHGEKMLIFSNGTDLETVLVESYATEFYLTDHDATFVLCSTHEDELVAVGDAISWLRDKTSHDESYKQYYVE